MQRNTKQPIVETKAPPYPPPLPQQIWYYAALGNEVEITSVSAAAPKEPSRTRNMITQFIVRAATTCSTFWKRISAINFGVQLRELLIIIQIIFNQLWRELVHTYHETLRVPYKAFRAIGAMALLLAIISFGAINQSIGIIAAIASLIQFGMSIVFRTRAL